MRRELDKAMHLWCTQERHKGKPIHDVLVLEKARLLYHELHPDKNEDDFNASSG